MSAWRTVRRCTWCRSANSRMLSPSSRCWRRILSNSSTLDNSFSLAPTVWQPRSVGAGARGWGHLWPSLRPLLGPDQAVIPRGPPRCALSATLMSCEDLLRGLPPCLAAASPVADLLGHGVALGDDLPGLIWGDRGVVGVADHLRHAAVHDRPGPLCEVGGDHTDGAEVVLAALDHLHVVDAGELGVEVAGGVGGTVKGGAQQPVAGLGDGLALAVAVASLGRAWGRPGGSSTPAGRHGARAQLGGPEQADLGLDLGGQVGEGHRGVVVVQLQRGVGGVEPLGGATGVLLAV